MEHIAEPAFLHVTAEAIVNSQSRRRISRNALHFCDGFEMTMEVVESEESMIGSVGRQNSLVDCIDGIPRECDKRGRNHQVFIKSAIG